MSTGTSTSLFGSDRTTISEAITSLEEVLCPLCRVVPEPFAVDYQGFQLCRCPKCDLQFLSPRPTFDQLSDKVYNESYHAEPDPPGRLSEASRYQFDRQYATIEELLGSTGSILDVGCGNGTFLGHGESRGWRPHGCDIRLSPWVREKPFPLWEGKLLDINFGGERFDAIRFNHVLEHTQDPLAELVRSRELIKPGGIVFVSVPNIGGISTHMKNLQSRLHLKRRRWRHYAALHHLWFFTPKTLRRVAENAGLRVLRCETPVLRKDGETEFITAIQRQLFEKTGTSSILDLYCTLD